MKCCGKEMYNNETNYRCAVCGRRVQKAVKSSKCPRCERKLYDNGDNVHCKECGYREWL